FRKAHVHNAELPGACTRCVQRFVPLENSWDNYGTAFRPYVQEIMAYTGRMPGGVLNPGYFKGAVLNMAEDENSLYLGYGWYRPELYGRWMTGSAEVYMEFPEAAQRLVIDFSSYNPRLTPQNPLTLRVRFHDMFLGEASVGPGTNFNTAVFEIPNSLSEY